MVAADNEKELVLTICFDKLIPRAFFSSKTQETQNQKLKT